MPRLGRVMLALTSALLLAPLPAHAAAPTFGWQLYQFNPPDQPVEQQTPGWPTADQSVYVTNPTRCAWDVDDLQQWLALPATMKAGASASMTACVVSDPDTAYTRTQNFMAGSVPRVLFGTKVAADNPGLTASVCYSPQGTCFSPTFHRQPDGTYLATSCSFAGYAYTDPAGNLPITNSNGGVGVVTTITVTVRNPTAKNVRNVTSDNEFIGRSQTPYSSDTSGCYSNTLPLDHFAYPLNWNAS